MKSFFDMLDKYIGLVLTVAIIAVVVSRRSSTASVIQTAASAMSNILATIVSPINSGAAANSTVNPPATETNPPTGGMTAPNGTNQPQGPLDGWMNNRPDVFSW